MIEPALYIVGLPIGNLEDLSFRSVNVLKNVDLIASEDTRHTLKLLNVYQIKKRLISCHEHNEQFVSKTIIENIKQGLSVAYVVDAGTPGLADPGELLVKMCHEANVKIKVIPGPSAAIAAAAASGFFLNEFTFFGFLPRKGSARKSRLQEIADSLRTCIIYESPFRIKKTLKELADICQSSRELVVAKELTKYNESIVRITFSEIDSFLEGLTQKGEFVLVIGPKISKDQSIKKNLS